MYPSSITTQLQSDTPRSVAPEGAEIIPAFPNFIKFCQVPYGEYQSRISGFDPYSDFNYVSVYSWDTHEDCEVSQLNGNLILSFHDYLDDKKLLTFIGSHKLAETAQALLEFIIPHEEYLDELVLMPEVVANDLIHSGLFQLHEDRDNHDYLLSANEALDLSGKKYENKRKNFNRFSRQFEGAVETRVIDLRDEKHKEDIRRLSQKWSDMGTDGSREAENELIAINRLLRAADKLCEEITLKCLGLYINGALEGFCIFEIHGNYAVTHFGKANISYSKAYEYLMISTLRFIYSEHGVDKVNNEQDLGIEGLRTSKMSQKPVGFLKKYRIAMNTR